MTTTKTAHTPGPWLSMTVTRGLHRVTDGKGKAIADIVASNPARDANARLIAAAPELLAALEFIAKRESDSITGVFARAVIAKAIGGTCS